MNLGLRQLWKHSSFNILMKTSVTGRGGQLLSFDNNSPLQLCTGVTWGLRHRLLPPGSQAEALTEGARVQDWALR